MDITQETCAIEQNSSNRDGKKEDRKEAVTEVSMKLCLVFTCPVSYTHLTLPTNREV